MATKYSISEQVLLRVAGGFPETASSIQVEDIIIACGQKINSLLRSQYLASTLPSGETIPDGLCIAIYHTPLPVYQIGIKSGATLPVYPISLPRNMGVMEVSPYIDFSFLYVPIQNGQSYLLKDSLLGDFQTAYEVVGNKIVFSEDIMVDNVKEVYVKMIVVDVSKLSEYDVLPISADMEDLIIGQLVKDFSPVGDNVSGLDNYVVKQDKK